MHFFHPSSSNHFLPFLIRSITKIVFRGPRSQGFGFVTFDKEADVTKAVETLKDSEFDGRNINVERVLPRSERPAREFQGSFRGRGFRGGRFPRRPRPTGPPSTTVIYIGNLPFNAIDKDLENIFSGYQFTSARIIYRPDGRSRGFGFVTMANEADQKRAIAELAGAECDNRALVIRAAVSEEHVKGEGNDNDDEE
jgi:RNA recognition motif-containing protein